MALRGSSRTGLGLGLGLGMGLGAFLEGIIRQQVIVVTEYLLQEDLLYLLQEDGSYIVL